MNDTYIYSLCGFSFWMTWKENVKLLDQAENEFFVSN